MKKTLSLLLIAVIGLAANQANADHTFATVAGPTNVVNGSPITLNFNDAGNTAGVAGDVFSTWTLTADWVAGGGNPFSSEAGVSIANPNGTTGSFAPTNPGSGGASVTGLSFTGGFAGGLYDTADGFALDAILDQSFGGSDADWSNISLTLNTFVPPPIPTTIGTLTASGMTGLDTAKSLYSTGIVWYELIYDGVAPTININTEGSTLTPDALGADDTEIALYDSSGFLIGSDDDGGTGALSSLDVSGLSAGTYYIAAGGWNATFGATDFAASSDYSGSGSLRVTVAVPEPTTFAGMIALAGAVVLRRRR